MNYRFDLDDWVPRFPLKERNNRYSAEIVTSPFDLCQNVQLRHELREDFDWGRAVPMDLFIMADGEPADRHVTKIGGLPYRPADADWPKGKAGNPLVFLAQFDFGDSIDITGPLPADVLLVFADDDHMPQRLHLEWRPLGLDRLVNELPAPSTFNPCYGHVCRVVSYPDWSIADGAAENPMCRGLRVSSEYYLPTYQATQIGTAPHFVQEGDPEGIIGRALCTISSVQPASDVSYPWINHPEPIPRRDVYKDKRLMLGDMGCIYISIDDDMKLHWHSSCH